MASDPEATHGGSQSAPADSVSRWAGSVGRLAGLVLGTVGRPDRPVRLVVRSAGWPVAASNRATVKPWNRGAGGAAVFRLRCTVRLAG